MTRGGEEEPKVSVVSFPFPLYCSCGWFGKGGRDMVRALERGDEYGDVWGDVEGKVSASRMVRIDLTMLSWITARQRIRSSRKAVGVYSR